MASPKNILATYYLHELPSITGLTAPQYNRTTSGYGSKLPTRYQVQLPGSKRWRRVYCMVYSNSGTCYVTIPGGIAVIRD